MFLFCISFTCLKRNLHLTSDVVVLLHLLKFAFQSLSRMCLYEEKKTHLY